VFDTIAELFPDEQSLHRMEHGRDFRRQRQVREPVEKLGDGHAEACPPNVFGPLGMHNLGVRKGDRALIPDGRARPIYLRIVAAE
jgi:hypothetical protein